MTNVLLIFENGRSPMRKKYAAEYYYLIGQLKIYYNQYIDSSDVYKVDGEDKYIETIQLMKALEVRFNNKNKTKPYDHFKRFKIEVSK